MSFLSRDPVLRSTAVAGIFVCLLAGCNVVGIFGAMAESYQSQAPVTVGPDYTGLQGKTFAVVVSVDRTIEADFASITAEITGRVSQRLADPKNDAGTTGVVPPIQILNFISNNPAWRNRSYSELAKELGGVDRLIYIELSEFRLGEEGNTYVWDGVASGSVAVIEADSGLPDEFAYQKAIKVTYPDQKGLGPEQINRTVMMSALLARFIDRASWPFYTHEERYPKFQKY